MHHKLAGTFLIIGVLCTLVFVGGQTKTIEAMPFQRLEMRCGWFSNPTPANASLHDRDSEWIIGVQGGYQAEGDWPDFAPKQWVKTNGQYGYGCACLRVQVDLENSQVIKIESSRAQPLTTCRRDRSLRRWEFK